MSLSLDREVSIEGLESEIGATPATSVSLNQLEEIELVEQDDLLNDEDIDIAKTTPLPEGEQQPETEVEVVEEVKLKTDFEFTCMGCFMVKNSSALADKKKQLCADCA